MSERIDDDPTLFDDHGQRNVWQSLEGLSQAEPGAALRGRVLADLHQHSTRKRSWWSLFLPAEPAQWAGVAAALVIGLTVGTLASRDDAQLDQRLAQLESQLVGVNQQLLMSRLTSTAPGERLAAVLDASRLQQRDPGIAAALLQRAAIDTVPSVRSAAIGALGQEINQPHTATQLLEVLSASESPIVQMAIIDLILRHGSGDLLLTLKQRASDGDLHPALAGYVRDTMGELDT